MNDLRVVIDTNVVVSALLLRESLPRRALDAALSQGTILLSLETVAELDDVLRCPKFNRYISEDERIEFLAALVLTAEQVKIVDTFRVCRDPRDDKYLEAATNGHATHIMTGDKDLVALNPFHGIAIVTPQIFLEGLAE